MTLVDWLAVALILVAALGGAAQGFVWSSLSLVGLAVGAVVGGRIAPLLLAAGVVRVLGTACGLGIEGSGWVARRGLVVTAAHVVAGETDTTVTTVSGSTLPAHAVVFDSHNDVAVLRVAGLSARPLRLVDPKYGTAVAIAGYPEDGPFDAVPGRLGSTVTVLTQDAYGRGPVRRTVTSLSGNVRHGDSGGVAVDASGAVQATVFAARANGSGG